MTERRDSSHDILRAHQHPLDIFFSPKSVALVGATENAGSVGRTLMWNLITNPFGGTVFPVNPKRASVLGVKAYPSIAALPDSPELAVISTPARSIPGIIRDCVDRGVRGAIVISAGFKETGAEGIGLEQELLKEAKRGGLRIVGPNCLGIMNPLSRFNATFAHGLALPGRVAFISQSGALCTAVLDWSLKERVGFSGFVSIGSMSDVGWGDLIDYFGSDPNTDSILIYMESVGDARSFISAARAVTWSKPVIVIKVGRSAEAAKAAASHTGSLTGSDDVLDAAFRRCGVLRVQRVSDLFYMAEVLSRQPRPRGPRLSIVTNAGGPGVLATDALMAHGGELTELSEATKSALNEVLPAAWSHSNPIDILGDAEPERYGKALEIAAKDPNADGLMVILTPQDMTDPTGTAEHLRKHAHIADKPVLASWMGGIDVAEGEAVLNRAGIPTFPYPDTAAWAFVYMWQYAERLKLLYETPSWPSDAAHVDRAWAQKIVDRARREGRTLLTEPESKDLLSAYGIPTVPTRIAASAEEAVQIAAELGFPVVLKIFSLTVTHKTDVGGVKLNLGDAAAVRSAFDTIRRSVTEKLGSEHFQGVTVQPMVRLDGYELILGASPDAQFGPVLLFGLGGALVEVFKDRSLGLPPLTNTFARRMIERTKIHTALKGVRGRAPVNLTELEQLMVRFSQLIVEQPIIKELDINPLLASSDRLVALDARVLLYGDTERPGPQAVIAPYPSQYIGTWTSKRGTSMTIRPICPEDEPGLARFHVTLSETTVYQRYAEAFQLSKRIAHERLTRICFIDYSREVSLVAESRGEILGVIRFDRQPDNHALISVVLTDNTQGEGLGTELVRRIVPIAKDLGVSLISAEMLPENRVMARVFEKVGFSLKATSSDRIRAELSLR